MTENARKVFDILGVKPYEWFKVDGIKEKIFIDEDLIIEDEEGFFRNKLLRPILTGQYKIIKQPKKKHVGDLICKELECRNCPLYSINCDTGDSYSNLYKILEFHYKQFKDKEIYDLLKKRLDKEVLENDK